VLIEACSLQINRFMNLLANMEFEYWWIFTNFHRVWGE
jgi:hypothetical protein